MNKCLNCDHPLNESFCSHCGQSANTHKLNFHFLVHDIQHGVLHFDKGFLFTSKELFTRPGYTIRDFIHGKRVKHFKPISMVLILAGIYGFLFHYFNISMLANTISVSGSGEEFLKIKSAITRLSDWMASHYAIVALLQIPIFTIGSFFAFYKAGYNFIEHFVLNTFLTAQRLIIHIVLFPFYYFFSGTNTLKITGWTVDIIGYALMAIALYQFFNNITLSRRIFKIIQSLGTSFILFLILFAILAGIYFASA